MPICPHCGRNIRVTDAAMPKHIARCPDNPERHYQRRTWTNGKQYPSGVGEIRGL